MRKTVLLIAYLAFTNPLFAQLEKGTWMLGGTASLRAFEETSTYNGINNGTPYNLKNVSNKLNYKIAPNLGYFIVDKLNVGLRTSYESSQTYFVEKRPSRTHSLSIGPFARYYVLNTDKLFNILIDASYQLGYNWWIQKPVDNTGFLNPKNSHNFGISAGPVVFLTENVALELSLGYTYQSTIKKDLSETINKGFNTGIGFQYHF